MFFIQKNRQKRYYNRMDTVADGKRRTVRGPGVLWFLALSAFAAVRLPALELTLDRALELALANNITLAKEKTALGQAEREAVFSWNQFMPDINFTGTISSAHSFKPQTSPGASWGASGKASLTLTSAIPVKMKQASVNFKIAQEKYRTAEFALVSSVSTGFYKLLAAKADIGILRDNLQLTRTQYEQTKRNYDNGLASELELLNAEYTYRTAGPAVDDAVTDYESSLASYLLTLGLVPKSDYAPAGEITMTALTLPPADELVSSYLENRADVRMARLDVEAAKLKQTLDRLTLRVPSPSINLEETVSLGANNPFDVKLDDVTAISGAFSVSVKIPITAWIPGSSQSLNIKADADAVNNAEKTLDNTLKQAELDIKKKADVLSQSAEKTGIAELNYRITGRAYELSEQGYRSGLVSQTDLMSARQRMVAARQAVLTAQTAYIDAVYSLASALGLSIDDMHIFVRQE
jgi:multidrug efflux system outer membrane protein